MIIVRILISVVFYFILLYISVNLSGLFVRGFFTNPGLDKLKAETKNYFIKDEIKKSERVDKWLSLIVFLGIIVYLYLTFHFWNIGVTAVAIVLMLVRLPGLLWEIKTSQQHNRVASTLSMPKNALHYATVFFTFVALPALYYFLYHFLNVS